MAPSDMGPPTTRYKLPPRFTESRPEQADPQSLFIARLLEKMPKDRVKSTTLPWPRTRKKAIDFLDLYKKTYPNWPASISLAQRYEETLRQLAQSASAATHTDGYEPTFADDIEMHDALMPELQPGSESEVSQSSAELSNDLCGTVEVDDSYMD
ncbi:hypothetical protein DIS24_g4662 [Lasiodiplodia hormozganensis]|uniref:Uncharacterized protein n=1 Tax=Lasiodiplodia hormozganensis TaxID=869390 RepID=A0AA39YVX6_9PEZI|nr:hypothetical protein DIS24_g4662 [Lasiodiplodia hormozganensis]